MLNFGYHPISDELPKVLELGEFSRGLVFSAEINTLFDHVGEVRTIDEVSGNLPSGVYWFLGIEQPLVMQIPTGMTGPSTQLQAENDETLDDHPLVAAFGWAEHFWETASQIPKPKFEIDSRAITVPGGVDVKVTKRTFYSGNWSYSTLGPDGNSVHLESKLQHIEVSDEPEDWVTGERSASNRFGATLTRTKLNGKFADTLYSYGASRTIFRPYQFKPVLKLLQNGQARLLIADEVGLGKTIEAGLIWTELEARHEADRVLIVCPSTLLEKWQFEMEERFGFELVNLNADERNKFFGQHLEGRLPKRKAYVISLEALRIWKALEEFRENPPEFDLVIVDEAHSMRNANTRSYATGLQLTEWTTGSNMIFLTATPINLHQTDLLNLLGLLDPSDFMTVDDLELKLEPNAILNQVGKQLTNPAMQPEDFLDILNGLDELALGAGLKLNPDFQELAEILSRAPLTPKNIPQARKLIGRLNTLSSTITRTRRAEVDEKKAYRDAEPGIQIVWNEAESEFYKEFLKWCEMRALAAGSATYFAMQMPLRLASTSIKLAAQSVLSNDDADDNGDDAGGKPKNWIEPHPELKDAAKRALIQPDTKVKRLRDVLENLHEQQMPALLFTWSKANLHYLKNEFQDDYRIAVLNGDVKREARHAIMKEFRAGHYDFVFANKVASEGLDFEFCSAVINFDLPWNPMEIEQRIGRIDRIGQKSDKILIRNFYNDEAIDARIMFRVLQRIEIFQQSIGELDAIIGQNLEILNSAMDFRLTEDQREAKIRQFETAIEAQRDASREIAESAAGLMIANDVEIDGLQEELTSTGRYLGHLELANLIDDWASTDGGKPIEWLQNANVAVVTGNPTMAARLNDLKSAGRRTTSEIKSLLGNLQNGIPINLALNQELARTTGIDLLTATHPLVVAAAQVPGHRQARFASIRIGSNEHVADGKYAVLISLASNASQGGDEIWGASVDLHGNATGEAPADALLSALAKGQILEGDLLLPERLPFLVNRAKLQLSSRHFETQVRRDREEKAFLASRKAILEDQHVRKLDGIQRRIETIVERGRGAEVLRMAEGQKRRQIERFQHTIAELESRATKSVSLKYVAACILDVRNG